MTSKILSLKFYYNVIDIMSIDISDMSIAMELLVEIIVNVSVPLDSKLIL